MTTPELLPWISLACGILIGGVVRLYRLLSEEDDFGHHDPDDRGDT